MTSSKSVLSLGLCSLVLTFAFSGIVVAQEQAAKTAAANYKRTVNGGVQYLLNKGQAEDGSYSKNLSTAITSMAATALMKNGVPAKNVKVQKAIQYVLKHVQKDGGIYTPEGTNLRNYETSLAIMCLVEANDNGLYDDIIENAVKYIKGIQWDEGEDYDRSTAFYGGAGYGSHKRPDASNTSFFMDALKAAGVDESSVEMQKAAEFMSKCQNLTSKHNMMEYSKDVAKEDVGGFIYSPANGGETKVVPAESETGGLRSYASMTYAGLKSFLYAGINKDDIRVQAALDWIRQNYSLTTNPGLGAQGLYYYYHVFAKALNAMGEDTFTDADGKVHDWRAELVAELANRQQEDGSWLNTEHKRWYEDNKNLATCYALLALEYCSPEASN